MRLHVALACFALVVAGCTAPPGTPDSEAETTVAAEPDATAMPKNFTATQVMAAWVMGTRTDLHTFTVVTPVVLDLAAQWTAPGVALRVSLAQDGRIVADQEADSSMGAGFQVELEPGKYAVQVHADAAAGNEVTVTGAFKAA